MKKDLTKGNILIDLIAVAIPIILTSLIQTAYNLMDMAWLGNYSTDAVSAAGTAGFFIWLSQAIVMLVRNGAQVKIAHAAGQDDDESIISYFRTSIQLFLLFMLVYVIIAIMLSNNLIGFFGLSSEKIYHDAVVYLRIGLIANIFVSLNMMFAGAFNGMGNSKVPLIISGIGLAINMVLDPIFIYVFDLGVFGAAFATMIAGIVSNIIFIYYIAKKTPLIKGFNLIKIAKEKVLPILNIGYPVAIHSALFSILTMIIAKLVVPFGDNAIAVQKIGSQVESLTWMTAMGVSTAMTAFVGQNYGAKKWDRIGHGYMLGLVTMIGYGLFTTLLLYFGAEFLFRIFNNDPTTIPLGIDYLKINSISQIAMIIEITTAGVLYGFGASKPPAIVSVLGNAARIPMAILLSSSIGLNGIWWALSISCFIKAFAIIIWFIIYIRRNQPNIKLEYFKIKLA